LNNIVIIPATLQRCCNNEFKFFQIEQQILLSFLFSL
jgi:hypothetical protein